MVSYQYVHGGRVRKPASKQPQGQYSLVFSVYLHVKLVLDLTWFYMISVTHVSVENYEYACSISGQLEGERVTRR